MKKLPVLILTAALAACSGGEHREAAPGVSLLKNLSIAESDSSSLRWHLDAAGGNLDEKKGVMAFDGPKIKFYDLGHVTSEITSRTGLLQMREKAAELTDDVQVDSKKDGMRLKTSKLYYSSARGKIWTERAVTIYRGRTVINGVGFVANPDLSEIEIQHQETRLSGK